MSIDIPTELLTASSGSVGDVVASRNQHGPYFRPRTTPTDPASAQQLAVRAALSECVTAWNATLTPAERKGWDVFALHVRTRAALGRSTNAGGLGMYIRANVPRLQAAEPSLQRVDVAPTLQDSGGFTPITRVVLNVVDDTIHPFFDASDDWPTETAAAMLFYASPPQPLTRNFWAGPYRYAGPILGRPFPPHPSPATLPIPFPATATDRVFIRGRVTRSDARLSPSFRLPADTVPQVPPLPTSAAIFAGPPIRIHVVFDALLRRQSLNRANWTARILGRNFNVTTAGVSPDRTFIALPGTLGTPNPGPNVVSYAPPPSDVVGLLTGLDVLAFTDFPIT